MAIHKPQITKAVVRGISTTDGGIKKFSTDVMPDEVLEGISTAQTTAESAQSTANTAKTTAETAQDTADTAQSNAETAQTTAESAQNTADFAKSTAETAQTTAESAQRMASDVKTSMSGVPTMAGLWLKSQQSGSQDRTYLQMSTKDSHTSMRLEESIAVGHVLRITRDGGTHDAATAHNPATLKLVNVGGVKGVVIEGLDTLIMNSSTSGSTKRFKITVDDTSTITATEVTT